MAESNKCFSWNTAEYYQNSSNPFEMAKNLIPKLELTGKESVLDIGCCDGKVTHLLSTYLPQGRAVGVDSSEEMIALARKNFPHCHNPNLTFLKMDPRNLTFLQEFDVAFSNGALHWIIDHQTVLACVHDSLDKGGRLLFQMAGKGNAQDIISVIEELISEEDCKPYFKNFTFPYGFYTPEQYQVWLEEAGFTVKRVDLSPKEMKLPGKEGLVGWIKSVWVPFTERVPANLEDLFVNEIAERYIAAYPLDETGVVRIKMMLLEVQATKA